MNFLIPGQFVWLLCMTSAADVLLVFFSDIIFLYCDQFTMEMASTEAGNMPKSYSLNMSKDIVPMSVFSETGHGEHHESHCHLSHV